MATGAKNCTSRAGGGSIAAERFEGLAVNPQTGETVQVKAQKLRIYNSDHTKLEGEGLVFDEPTAWPAADSLVGLMVCDMCRYYTRDEDSSYCIYKPSATLKLCEPHNSICQHYEHAGEISIASQPNTLARYHLTDMGNSKRFLDKYSDTVRYCRESGTWLVWNGTRWQSDTGGLAVKQLAKNIVEDLYTEALGITDVDEKRKMLTFALRCETDERITGMVKLAMTDTRITVSQNMLDKQKYKTNVMNGVIDLTNPDDIRLIPHEEAKGEYHTKIVNASYEPGADCPLWKQCMETWMNGNTEDIKFVQKALGYSLTGDTSEHCLFILWGSGRNGKSTFIHTIGRILGDYAATTSIQTFIANKHTGIPNDIARLEGKRFVSTFEVDNASRLAEGLVKQLTGGDTLSARYLFKEYFEYVPEFKVFMATNLKPVISSDEAIWSRIRLIPFVVVIPPEKRIANLAEKLFEERSGILNWMLEGYKLWRKEGLKMSTSVYNATNEYRYEMDTVRQFVSECCEIDKNLGWREKNQRLYDAYIKYCEETGAYAASKNKFLRELRTKYGLEQYRGGAEGERGLLYIRLKAPNASSSTSVEPRFDTTDSSQKSSVLSENCQTESVGQILTLSDSTDSNFQKSLRESESKVELETSVRSVSKPTNQCQRLPSDSSLTVLTVRENLSVMSEHVPKTSSQERPCQADVMKALHDIVLDLTNESIRVGGPKGAYEKNVIEYLMTYNISGDEARRLVEDAVSRGLITRLPNAPAYYCWTG